MKQPDHFASSNMQFVSNYPSSFVPQGYSNAGPQMNMAADMGYMQNSYQQNEIALANYTHSLNMMSANMNPYGNIPPPPQQPMPEYPQTGFQGQPGPRAPGSRNPPFAQPPHVKKEDN